MNTEVLEPRALNTSKPAEIVKSPTLKITFGLTDDAYNANRYDGLLVD